MHQHITEALEWAAEEATKAAARARAMIGLPGVEGDIEGYAQKLERHAAVMRNVLESPHPAPVELEEWARQIDRRVVNVEDIDDIHVLRGAVVDFAEAFVRELERGVLDAKGGAA